MFKKIVLFALLILPVAAFAQESQKIAHVNYLDVIYSMPETKQMEDSLKKAGNESQIITQEFQDTYNKKLADYIAQRDTLSESIRVYRETELQDIIQKAENFQQFAQQKHEELQQTLLTPIQAKLKKAVDDVGSENNFLYIINADPQILFFISPNAADATPLVKRKLGIQ